MQTVSDSTNFLEGIFVKELKNRFLCLVIIDGTETVCYIPSSSRLENYVKLKGKTVLLKKNDSKTASTEYAVFAVKHKRNYLLLNTSIANSVLQEGLKSRMFSFLGKRKSIVREKKLNSYKADLFIEDTNTIIEIKSIISVENDPIFPSVHSDRANSQLNEIDALLEQGYNVNYCFVSLNPYITEISLNQSESEYFERFKNCLDKGMTCFGLSLELKDNIPKIKKSIKIKINNYEI